MVSFGEAIKQQGRVVMCNLLGGPSSVPYLGGTPNPDINALQRRINGARKYFCNESDGITEQEIIDDYPGGFVAGGQCPGQLYNLSYLYDSVIYADLSCGSTVDFIGLANTTNNLLGPIENPRVEFSGTGECGPSQAFWRVDTGNGVVTLITGSAQETGRVASRHKLYDLVAQPVGGGPDNCGDFSGDIPPYSPTTVTVNIEYEDNSQTTINEEVNYTIFAPVVLIGGAIIAPITVTGNDFSLVGELALNGEFELSFSPDFELNIGGSVDNPIPPPGRPIELPEVAPSSRVIVGAIVTVTDAQGGRATQIGQGTNPDIFAPRLGNISFYVSTSRGTAWTTDVPIKNVRQYVQCPYPFGAVDVAATPETGYAFDVQPVFDRPLLEST